MALSSTIELTQTYEQVLKKLTPKGAQELASCALERFLDCMRNTRTIEPSKGLTYYVLTSVRHQTVQPTLSRVIPWIDHIIETHDATEMLTARSILDGSYQVSPQKGDGCCHIS